MNDLNRKAFGGLLKLMIALAAMIFLPAWTIRYWQAWIFLLVFFICVTAITVYLMHKDPKLLERRVSAGASAEKETSQKIIQALAAVAFVATIAVPAADHRFGWSAVPVYAVIAGDGLIAVGLMFVFLVFKANSFTSGIIEVAEDQKVISTGPYGVVRHPMYLGALIMLAGIPPALGSWWGLLSLIPMTLILVFRLTEEEKFLARNLPGYADYMQKVSYHLVPFVW